MVARKEGGIRENQGLKRFTAQGGDLSAKDQIDLMSRCWFSLTPGRSEPIEHAYQDNRSGRTETVRITSTSESGMATIHDQDLLIFAISHWVDAKRLGLEPTRRIHFTPYQFFAWMNREPSGGQYKRIREALNRLKTTTIETTIRSEKGKRTRSRVRQFSWISEWEITEENGEIRGIEVVLAEWLFESVQDFHVLTLDKRYFDIRGSVERWLYLYARKATGGPTGMWKETFKSLYRKSASQQAYKHYASSLRKLIQRNDLPGLALEQAQAVNGGDMLLMRRTEKRTTVKDAPTLLEEAVTEQVEQTELEDAWENVLEQLRHTAGESIVRAWLEKLTPEGMEGKVMVHRAPTEFVASQVECHYSHKLKAAWNSLGYKVETNRFEWKTAPKKGDKAA